MKDYKDFTVDEDKFPNFAEYVKEKKEQGIHLIPIIDAGVKKKQATMFTKKALKTITSAKPRTARFLKEAYGRVL